MLGFDQGELSRSSRVVFAVRPVKLEFMGPTRFNDLLQATVIISKRGNTSLTFKQKIRCGIQALCQGEIKVACLDARSLL